MIFFIFTILVSGCLVYPGELNRNDRIINVEALGFLDLSKSKEIYLYETEKKKTGYKILFTSDNVKKEAGTLIGRIVKVKGKIRVSSQKAGEKQVMITSISIDEIKPVDLVSAFFLKDEELQALKFDPPEAPGRSKFRKSENKGYNISDNVANTLIFLGGAALVGKIIHDHVKKD